VLGLVATTRYLVSTNGAKYNHPDREAMLRIVQGPERRGRVELVFNYASASTLPWGKLDCRRRYDYEAVFPVRGAMGVAVEI